MLILQSQFPALNVVQDGRVRKEDQVILLESIWKWIYWDQYCLGIKIDRIR